MGARTAVSINGLFARFVNSRDTLHEQGIEYHFSETVPYIMNKAGDDICPMEKLSLGKSSEEFFPHLRRSLSQR